jgi:hypothetical protein
MLLAPPLLVVRRLDRPGAHARGPGALVRGRRRRAWAGGDRQQGALVARVTRGWCCTAGAGVRRRPRLAFAGCWPGDAARKGKVERPFRELKEAFLEELVLDLPTSIGELNTAPRRGWPRWSTPGPTA